MSYSVWIEERSRVSKDRDFPDTHDRAFEVAIGIKFKDMNGFRCEVAADYLQEVIIRMKHDHVYFIGLLQGTESFNEYIQALGETRALCLLNPDSYLVVD